MKYFLSAINEADGYGIEKYFISALQGGSNLDTGDDVGEGVCQYLSITDQLRIGQSYCLRWVVVNNFYNIAIVYYFAADNFNNKIK